MRRTLALLVPLLFLLSPAPALAASAYTNPVTAGTVDTFPDPTMIRAKDGRWVQCGNLLEHLLLAFLEATDLLGEMLADERFLAPPGSWDEATEEAARDLILVRLQERTADEWMDVFRANGNVAAEPYLTTSMKSVGEVMAIGRTFAESVQKALRGLETGLSGFDEVEIPGTKNAEPRPATVPVP